MKILLVEDDLSVGQLLSNTLTACRYAVDIATDGQSGLELALQEEYAVILLDIMLPKLDGLSVCRQLRNQRCPTPILMLTVKDSSEDIVTGLDAGADDYITKPYEPSHLIARIRALSRRQGSTLSSPILVWGELRFDLTLVQVAYQQQIIPLVLRNTVCWSYFYGIPNVSLAVAPLSIVSGRLMTRLLTLQ